MPAAEKRCAHISALLGVPVEPMMGLLAAAALDELDVFWADLRALAAHRDGFAALEGSFAGFLAASLPVSFSGRRRLLERLDLFGIALGVAAARQAARPVGTHFRALLYRVSRIEVILGALAGLGASVRYQRVRDAVVALEALAVTDQQVEEFLRRDDTVIARMTAALDFAEASGLGLAPTACPADPAAMLARATRWHRYSRGCVNDLHRACGVDIARGSLRVWSRGAGSGESA